VGTGVSGGNQVGTTPTVLLLHAYSIPRLLPHSYRISITPTAFLSDSPHSFLTPTRLPSSPQRSPTVFPPIRIPSLSLLGSHSYRIPTVLLQLPPHSYPIPTTPLPFLLESAKTLNTHHFLDRLTHE